MTEKGRIQMIRELQGIADFFNRIDQQLFEITHKWAERHGITEELLQRHLEELVRNA